MSYFKRRLERRTRQMDNSWLLVLELGIVIVGCMGFANWQGHAGAGWWMFAAFTSFDEAASIISLGLYAGLSKQETPDLRHG